jgi:hypothetical protein
VTIRKGQDWGEPGALAPHAPVADDDAEAAALLQAGWPLPTPIEIGVLGGDLHQTLGEPHHDEDDLRSGRGMRLPMDAGSVVLDSGEPVLFVAHLVAQARPGRGWWNGRTVVVTNGSFVEGANLGPRAHPNDGRLDLTDGELPRGQRRTGRRRALTGTHVPHPDLSEARITERVIESEVPLHVRLDGRPVGTARRLDLRCHPDAWIAVV